MGRAPWAETPEHATCAWCAHQSAVCATRHRCRRGGGISVRDMTMGSNVSSAALSENIGSAIVSLGWSDLTGEGDAGTPLPRQSQLAA